MIISRKKYFIFILTALLLCCAVIFFIRRESGNGNKQEDEIFLKAVPVQTAYGWGYNILANDKIYIHQDYIPAAAGKQGFKTPQEALRVANRVIEKIRQNKLPTITPEDLNRLHIDKK